MWTDNETEIDLLGFKVHADLIHSVVTDESLLPVVLGVFGDWGSGKSSIMKMLENTIEPEDESENDDVVCLYFNGWMFEGYEDAKTALLTSILLELGENKRFGPRIKGNVVDLLKRIEWMEVLKSGGKITYKYGVPLAITALSGGTVPAWMAPLIADALAANKQTDTKDDEADAKPNWSKLIREKKDEDDLLEVRKFREDFEKLLAETGIKSLVIIIDDLDRCLPERIIETLEAIKLFVLVPKTAFVIGADPRIVRHAIRNRYAKQKIVETDEKKDELDDLAKDYLEKLIQIPYQLPRLSPSEIETYINLLSCQKYLLAEDNAKVRADWEKKRSENFYAPYQFGAINEVLRDTTIPPDLARQLSWSNSIADVVSEGLNGNPRQVKRMLNALLLRRKLADVAKIDIKDEILAKLMVLEYANLPCFLELNNWQAAEDGKPSRLASLESVANSEDEKLEDEDGPKAWQTPAIRKWLQMKPLLKDTDLRDYFWLARDRTSSTLGGVEMVPPIVRRLYTTLIEGNDGERPASAKDALSLSENDRASLLGLLKQHIRRHPDEFIGYSALGELETKKFPGAIGVLLSSLEEVDESLIPPTVAPLLVKLKGSSQDSSADIDELLSKHKSKSTKFGKAAKGVLK
ncbi:MAG: P-loop NTPase fold protein [Pyrinomonadaceae bacterium]